MTEIETIADALRYDRFNANISAEEIAAKVVDALRATPKPVQSGAGERPRWKHKNRGTMYIEIGRGKLQTMDAGGLTDGEPMVIYRGDDGQLWCRDQVEFEDGRFEFVPPSRQPPQSSSEGERPLPQASAALPENENG